MTEYGIFVFLRNHQQLNEQIAAEAQTPVKEARFVAEEAKTIVQASDEKFVT